MGGREARRPGRGYRDGRSKSWTESARDPTPAARCRHPFDRPVVGTVQDVNRRLGSGASDTSIPGVQPCDFVSAMAETLAAESLTRVLYPDDSTARGQGLRFVQEYFLVACSLADLVRRFQQTNGDWTALPEKVAVQLNDTHPAVAVPELLRILLDKAHLDWDRAWDLTQRTLAYTNHTHCPRRWKMAARVVRADVCRATSRSSRDQPAAARDVRRRFRDEDASCAR